MTNPDDQDPLLDAAFAYLSDYHATLWGDWDISRPDRRRAAARWLAEQVRNTLSHVPEFNDPYPPSTFRGPLTEEPPGRQTAIPTPEEVREHKATLQHLYDEGVRLCATYTEGQQAEVW